MGLAPSLSFALDKNTEHKYLYDMKFSLQT